jgi:hypothetical protein
MRWGIDRQLIRLRLRTAASHFAEHGWSITPGAWLTGDRFDCTQANCTVQACHPARADWAESATTDPGRVHRWWRDEPHAVLLATGRSIDVIEVPALLGARAVRGPVTGPGAASVVDQARGPVAVTPSGRWMFLVRPDDGLRPCLDRGVLLHGAGSWVPLPPTRLRRGPVRWEVTPSDVDWWLPSSGEVQRALVAAMISLDAGIVDASGFAEPMPLHAAKVVARVRPMATSRISTARRLRQLARPHPAQPRTT